MNFFFWQILIQDTHWLRALTCKKSTGKGLHFFFLALIQTLAIYLFINFLNQKIIVTRSTGAH